ncbi:MAG: hypothetical protein CMC08_02245 [Flavobacteriaceae bacterium]|nr:hypothetical protein [Flavobacteriaceae bacterium]
MKPATVAQLKKELNHKTAAELLSLCLRLAKFKKENKELLTYLLFDADQEAFYITQVKEHIDEAFGQMNTTRSYFMKKSVRKILKETKKYIRYSLKKETEVELLLYFCEKLKNTKPSISKNRTLSNLYERQLALIEKKLSGLHEDLQYDYQEELRLLRNS